MFGRVILVTILTGLVPADAGAQSRAVPGDVLLAPIDGASETLPAALARSGLEVLETDARSGVIRVRVPVGQEREWLANLNARPDVRYAERNPIGRGGVVADDSGFSNQWHLHNTGQVGGVVGADIRATAAWDLTTGASDTVIAVLDSGIDMDHPEFIGRIDPDGFDFVHDDPDAEDDLSHGTQVAGAMCANTDNAFGVAGVDWQCKVLPIKVIDSNNFGTTFDLAQGLNYAAAQSDVRVILMSLIEFPGTSTLLSALQNARDAGKILIACAGNGGVGDADLSYPGAAPQTIAIGATTRTDDRAWFSATGAALDFVAPGHEIVTVRYDSAADLTTTLSGCSFSAPIAAGLVGLLLARADDLGLAPLRHEDVHALLRAGAVDQVGSPSLDTPGRDDFFGEGRIDARASLDALEVFSCWAGDVGTVVGARTDVLRADDSVGIGLTRRIALPIDASFELSVEVPPSNPAGSPVPAAFALWGHIGLADDGPTALPFGIGELCFDLANPLSFFAIGATAPWLVTIPSVSTPLSLTLQGVILDTPQAHLAVTNAIFLEIAIPQ